MKVLQVTSPHGGTLSYEYESDEDLVTEKSSTDRLHICKKCESFISLTTTCKECGCFMKLKTKIKKSSCPLNKW